MKVQESYLDQSIDQYLNKPTLQALNKSNETLNICDELTESDNPYVSKNLSTYMRISQNPSQNGSNYEETD